TNALAIAALRGERLTVLDADDLDATANDFHRALVGRLGSESRQARDMTSSQDVLARQAERQRESVRGVSLDEEMTNLVRFQTAYDAAARVVTVVDEMLETVVRRMGRVGQ
ncbi:MAG: flagellar hook-associated protein FlgK, partial [Clostridia bacterium]|nr:flagellar hook-associated protein FlgK [Clostridia bacterium]